MKLAIVGSREYKKLELISHYVERYREEYRDLVIVSGGCRGVDKTAENYAKDVGIPVKIFYASWNTPEGRYDPQAGIKRNKLIADYCDELLCFYCGFDYKKSGSLSTVEMVAKRGKPWYVIGEWNK